MENRYSLTGKVALVTGGSRGIGRGIAAEFIRQGARVAITGTNKEALAKTKSELGESCFMYVNDVTQRAAHRGLIERIEQEIGPLDILVNNAGRHGKMPSMECSDEAFAAILDTNLHSVFSLTKAALPGMIDRGSGSIINISSMAALFGLPQVSAYSSSKTALLGLTRTLTVEYSGHGVRFNCIAPGFIESKMFRDVMNADPAREQKILGRTPAKRVGTAQEIGYAAAFLASDAAQFITGVCLPVDGGASIGF
jgi:NAD(P)-dependent dehydrogenase (short-subunit alcohol dehydrogenase family)